MPYVGLWLYCQLFILPFGSINDRLKSPDPLILIEVDTMFSAFFRGIKAQILEINAAVRTREFWIYVGVILVLILMVLAFFRLATAFDPMTRSQLGLAFSCRTGDGQLATIIIGGLVFVLLCVFTMGEVIHWVEETRILKAKGRERYKVGYWRPILHVIGTVIIGAVGYTLLLSWCT